MKKFISILIALSLCFTLAACGGDSAPADSTEGTDNVISTENQNSENQNSNTGNSAGSESLPMNIGGAYSCNLGGYDGYVMVEQYEIMPDEMNPGCEVRTAYVSTLFNNVPQDFEAGLSVFSLDGKPESIDDGVYIFSEESGDNLIFMYDNTVLYSSNDDGIYSSRMMVSYMVPDWYDEVAFAVVNGSCENALDSKVKTDVVSASPFWFVMGSMSNGVLTYNGSAVATAAPTADSNDLALKGEAPDDWDSGYAEEPVFVNKTSEYINEGSITDVYSGNRFLAFNSIELVSCSETTNTVAVNIFYSGFEDGDSVRVLFYDSFNKDEWLEQEQPVSGEGSVTFEFVADAAHAPYYVDATGLANGSFLTDFNLMWGIDVY